MALTFSRDDLIYFYSKTDLKHPGLSLLIDSCLELEIKAEYLKQSEFSEKCKEINKRFSSEVFYTSNVESLHLTLLKEECYYDFPFISIQLKNHVSTCYHLLLNPYDKEIMILIQAKSKEGFSLAERILSQYSKWLTGTDEGAEERFQWVMRWWSTESSFAVLREDWSISNTNNVLPVLQPPR